METLDLILKRRICRDQAVSIEHHASINTLGKRLGQRGLSDPKGTVDDDDHAGVAPIQLKAFFERLASIVEPETYDEMVGSVRLLRSPFPMNETRVTDGACSNSRARRTIIGAILVMILIGCGPAGESIDVRGGAEGARSNESAAESRDRTAIPAVEDSGDLSGIEEPSSSKPQISAGTGEIDPWLLEGIPNFEDVVALRKGDWIVILASGRADASESPTVTLSDRPGIAALQKKLWREKIVPWIV